MHFTNIITSLTAYATLSSAAITWSLQKSDNPTPDEADAYTRIEAAMEAGVGRYNSLINANKVLRVRYDPGIPTAEANYNGDLGFGANRSFMSERVALHEISHTLGVGQTSGFDANCAAGNWPTANPLLQSWDGAGASISCGGGHFWPYGLNYDDEWSEGNADRHCLLVEAMMADGMWVGLRRRVSGIAE